MKLIKTSRGAAGREEMSAHEFRHIDVRRARYELRVDLKSQSKGAAGRFVVDMIDPDVVQRQKMPAAMQFAGQCDVGGEVCPYAAVPHPLSQSRGQMGLQDETVWRETHV